MDVKVLKNVFADEEGHILRNVEDKVRKEVDALRKGGVKGLVKEVEDQVRPLHQHGIKESLSGSIKRHQNSGTSSTSP